MLLIALCLILAGIYAFRAPNKCIAVRIIFVLNIGGILGVFAAFVYMYNFVPLAKYTSNYPLHEIEKAKFVKQITFDANIPYYSDQPVTKVEIDFISVKTSKMVNCSGIAVKIVPDAQPVLVETLTILQTGWGIFTFPIYDIREIERTIILPSEKCIQLVE